MVLQQFLRKTESKKESELDGYGWAADFLSLIVNIEGTSGNPSPLQTHCRLIKTLSQTSKVPDAAAYILAAGALTGLNKVTREENIQKVQKGEDPSLRPINSGTTILKHIGTNTLKSDHGKEMMKTLAVTNKGFRGIEGVIHAVRGAYNKKRAVVKVDAQNFFNRVDGAALVD